MILSTCEASSFTTIVVNDEEDCALDGSVTNNGNPDIPGMNDDRETSVAVISVICMSS